VKLILYSLDDVAGCNIAKAIREGHGFTDTGGLCLGERVFGRGDVLLVGSRANIKDISDFPLKPEVCLVASRHKSESGKPTLTCHPTGNFRKAELGGQDGLLQLTDARYLRASLLSLRRKKDEYGLEHEVSMEVTHHGPSSLPFPLLYVEVGSAPPQWEDMRACKAAAEAIWEVVSGVEDRPSAIGFGGPHYAPNFNPLAGVYAIGHIMPKYAEESLSDEMVAQMLEKTRPRPQLAIVDWKGFRGESKDKLKTIAERLGLKLERSSDLK
jgi:D-aminoacyl-tRNA deacylase